MQPRVLKQKQHQGSSAHAHRRETVPMRRVSESIPAEGPSHQARADPQTQRPGLSLVIVLPLQGLPAGHWVAAGTNINYYSTLRRRDYFDKNTIIIPFPYHIIIITLKCRLRLLPRSASVAFNQCILTKDSKQFENIRYYFILDLLLFY